MARTEPAVDRAALLKALQQEYGISPRELRFVPTYCYASCYALEGTSGERYFVKVYGDWAPPTFVASSLEFYLPLTHELHARGILPNIAHPIPTLGGRFCTSFGGFLLILFDFIDGTVVGHGNVTGEVLASLARMVGKLHRSAVQIELPRPLVERFDIVFDAELSRVLRELPQIAPDGRTAKRDLRDLLLRKRDQVWRYLGRLRELQARVKTADRPMVVCHTDLHGENLMMDEEGTLYILDWENAMVAPPEHDLFFFAGHDSFWEVFLPHYEREFGPARLDLDMLGFYYYRRGLEDISCWLARILDGRGSEAQDQSDLKETAECLKGLSLVEGTLAEIEQRQHSRSRSTVRRQQAPRSN